MISSKICLNRNLFRIPDPPAKSTKNLKIFPFFLLVISINKQKEKPLTNWCRSLGGLGERKASESLKSS